MGPLKFLFRTFIILVILVVIIAGAAVWYISPKADLSLSYKDVDVKEKAMEMLKNRKPQIRLSGEELNELAKKELVKHMSDIPQQVEITGAQFHFHGQEVTADVNGSWGWIPFGAELVFHMEADGDKLVLQHQSTRIRSISIPSSTFAIPPVTVSLKDHLPSVLDVDNIQFLDDGVLLSFKIDWISLPSMLLK